MLLLEKYHIFHLVLTTQLVTVQYQVAAEPNHVPLTPKQQSVPCPQLTTADSHLKQYTPAGKCLQQ